MIGCVFAYGESGVHNDRRLFHIAMSATVDIIERTCTYVKEVIAFLKSMYLYSLRSEESMSSQEFIQQSHYITSPCYKIAHTAVKTAGCKLCLSMYLTWEETDSHGRDSPGRDNPGRDNPGRRVKLQRDVLILVASAIDTH